MALLDGAIDREARRRASGTRDDAAPSQVFCELLVLQAPLRPPRDGRYIISDSFHPHVHVHGRYGDDGLSCWHAEVAQLPVDPGSLQFCAKKLGRRRCVAAAET